MYYLIFDFDGTLVDSFHCIIEKFNLLAEEFNYQKINIAEIEKVRYLTSTEFIQQLKIPIHKIPAALSKVRKHLSEEILTLATFDNFPGILKEFFNRGYHLGIVTSNSKENVNKWLARYNLQALFSFIYVDSSFFGKQAILKKILKSYKIEKSKAFYIGDETRDIEAAKACEIGSVAVTWGFNCEEILQKYQPNFLARQPVDLLTIL